VTSSLTNSQNTNTTLTSYPPLSLPAGLTVFSHSRPGQGYSKWTPHICFYRLHAIHISHQH